MKKIASSKKYMFKIASYRNYRELQKIAAVGPGVIVGGPRDGLMLPPSTRPEDNPMESVLRPSEDEEYAPDEEVFVSSQEPVSFEETQAPSRRYHSSEQPDPDPFSEGFYNRESQRSPEKQDREYYQRVWDDSPSEAWWKEEYTNAEQFIESAIEKERQKIEAWADIEPMTPEEFSSKYNEYDWNYKNLSDEDKRVASIEMLIVETIFRVNGAYDGEPYPPALEKLNRLVADSDYKKIRSTFNQIWTEVIKWHRDNEIQLTPRVSHNLRTIDTTVRNM
tara:strand:- start:2746 stop:3579 length:834 start_codon:yes stop_codon:yes gene_type:complete